VIVVGGGITTDVGAFAASTWKRGCKLVLIPTTAMAMADAAIGGKTAVNYKNTKNLIGTFYQPESIIIDRYFLHKLPKEIKDLAFAEMIKHAIGFDATYFKNLIKKAKRHNTPDGFEFYIEEIHKSVEIKLNIVKKDPEERHLRKLLNIGHTVGHAIETAYQIPHGKAVFIGMLLELKTFKHLGLLKSNNPITMLYDIYYYAHVYLGALTIKFDDILPYMVHDKKKSHHNLTIPVVKEVGQTELCNIPMNEFLEALKKAIDETFKG
jgi:3-dehydroquinate synthase